MTVWSILYALVATLYGILAGQCFADGSKTGGAVCAFLSLMTGILAVSMALSQ